MTIGHIFQAKPDPVAPLVPDTLRPRSQAIDRLAARKIGLRPHDFSRPLLLSQGLRLMGVRDRERLGAAAKQPEAFEAGPEADLRVRRSSSPSSGPTAGPSLPG